MNEEETSPAGDPPKEASKEAPDDGPEEAGTAGAACHGPAPHLDDQLCFTLYAASRALTALYRPLLDAHGLTYPQYLVMLVLWERGSAPVKDLVTTLQLDYGTLTPLIKRLEANGLVARVRRTDDERVVEVVPTEQGTALKSRIGAVPPAIGNAMGLELDEIDTVRRLVRRLTANVLRTTSGAAPGPAGDTRA